MVEPGGALGIGLRIGNSLRPPLRWRQLRIVEAVVGHQAVTEAVAALDNLTVQQLRTLARERFGSAVRFDGRGPARATRRQLLKALA